jgi:hypothetical protein
VCLPYQEVQQERSRSRRQWDAARWGRLLGLGQRSWMLSRLGATRCIMWKWCEFV